MMSKGEMTERTIKLSQNSINLVTIVAPGWLGYHHVGTNLCVPKPYFFMFSHLMTGHMIGFNKLASHAFDPTYYVGLCTYLCNTITYSFVPYLFCLWCHPISYVVGAAQKSFS